THGRDRLVPVRARGIERALADRARGHEACLALVVAFGFRGRRAGPVQRFPGLRDLLRAKTAVELVDLGLGDPHRCLGRSQRILVRPGIEPCHPGPGGDRVTFLESHFRHPPRLAECQLHLADVDVAVEHQGLVAAARALDPDGRDGGCENHRGADDDDPLAGRGTPQLAHCPPPLMPRRKMAKTIEASRRMRPTSPATMAWITRPWMVPTNSRTAASTSSPGSSSPDALPASSRRRTRSP